LFDENSPTVKKLIRMLIAAARAAGRPVGICGQAPSDRPEFARFLVRAGIDTISLNPDSIPTVRRVVAQEEARSDGSRPVGGDTRGGQSGIPPERRLPAPAALDPLR
jgi:phosphoenolpyruvate-protein kinase (PTS system EI component)